ncbi:hypothetical protein [Marinicellulosiphila megalodicopiae]|uniref:hypothetical protein n=1 Tax=Marinicellulosiphila megalodicopiae TaxID=2724896 RepID=UPI003BB08643
MMSGEHFGNLTVIKNVALVKHGRNNVKIWLCKCACGNTVEIDQTSLKKGLILACKTCRRGPCVICGGKINDDSFSVKRNTCSEICRKQQINNKHLKRYIKQVADDPDHNKKRYQQRLESDENYNKHRYEKKLERISKLSQKEQKLIKSKENKATSEWRSKYVQNLKETDPVKYAKYIERSRRALRMHYQRKELSRLRILDQKITNIEENNDD